MRNRSKDPGGGGTWVSRHGRNVGLLPRAGRRLSRAVHEASKSAAGSIRGGGEGASHPSDSICLCACVYARAAPARSSSTAFCAPPRALAGGGGSGRAGGGGRAGRAGRGGTGGAARRARAAAPAARSPGAGRRVLGTLVLPAGVLGPRGRNPMEAIGQDSCGGGDAARGSVGRPAPEARVHFRVTRFIMEAGNLGGEEVRPCVDGTWRPGPRRCTLTEPALARPGRAKPAGRGRLCGVPLPGGGDSRDTELARLGRGERLGPKRTSAFPPRPVSCALSCEADAVIVISRLDEQAQREDVERNWPQPKGRRVGAPVDRLRVQHLWARLSPSPQGHCVALGLTRAFRSTCLVRFLTSRVGEVLSHRGSRVRLTF